MGPEMWTNWCTAVWWPYDEEKCVQTRCLACSPSVMSASVSDSVGVLEHLGLL